LTNLRFSDYDSTAKKDLDVATKKDLDVAVKKYPDVATKKDPDVVKEPNHYVVNTNDLGPSMEEIIRVQELLKQNPPADNVIKSMITIFVKGLRSEE
jgi:hypothetical protein